MTAPKRNITSHKHPPTKSSHPAGQSFDIIPRSQVRPTVTARPVLTPTRPEQADNTLQTSTQAATSQLKHGTLSFTPSAPELNENDAESLLDQVASISAEVGGHKAKPAIDDKDQAQDSLKPESDNELESEDKLVVEPGPDPEVESDASKEPVNVPDEVFEDSEPESEPKSELEPDAPSEAPAKTPGSKDPGDGSIDHIFNDDPQQSIEHSQALKDELQNIDEKPEEAVHPHHELYGGKPVIVIHKAHSAQATLNVILWFVFCLLLALVIVDVLLDSGVITTDYNIPHTRWLQ